MPQKTNDSYVHSLDWVRALTIVAVVLVHAIRFALVPSQPVSGNLLQLLFQFGRESFMVVTGFIIAFQYRDRGPNWAHFFKRRGKSALLPYLIWLAIFLVPEVPLWHPLPYLSRYLHILPNGNGHLYYMIITLQMYVLSPFLVMLLNRFRSWHLWLASVAVAWELLSWTMTGYFHLEWSPSLFVTTYVGYFVLGGVLGSNWVAVKEWLAGRRGWFTPVTALAVLTATVAFFFDVHLFGRAKAAINVFQPISVIYTLIIFAALMASGTWFEKTRVQRQWLAHLISVVADASFGIYLVHPLFVHGWLHFVQWQGLAINPYLNTLVTGIVGVGFSVAAVFGIRLLSFSEAIIGTVRKESRSRRSPDVPSSMEQRRTAVGER